MLWTAMLLQNADQPVLFILITISSLSSVRSICTMEQEEDHLLPHDYRCSPLYTAYPHSRQL